MLSSLLSYGERHTARLENVPRSRSAAAHTRAWLARPPPPGRTAGSRGTCSRVRGVRITAGREGEVSKTSDRTAEKWKNGAGQIDRATCNMLRRHTIFCTSPPSRESLAAASGHALRRHTQPRGGRGWGVCVSTTYYPWTSLGREQRTYHSMHDFKAEESNRHR